MTDTTITTDIAKFGRRERKILREILEAWDTKGLPDEFYDDEVVPMLNTNSGFVFLTNSDYQVALLRGDKLELWHSCPECGFEGFADELLESGKPCCKAYVRGEDPSDADNGGRQ